MNQIDIKNLGYRWKGVYNPNFTYEKNDVVRKEDGSVYFNSSSSSPVWELMNPGYNQGYDFTNNAGDLISNTFTPGVKTLSGVHGQQIRVNSNGSLGYKFADERRSAGIVSLAKTTTGKGTMHGGGWTHMMAIMTDGSLQGWGRQDVGQLGDGKITGNSATPTYFPSSVGFRNGTPPIIKVVIGCWECLAIDAAGGLWSWGRNVSGVLGIGTITNTAVPTKVNGFGDLPANAKVTDVVIRTGTTSQAYETYTYALIKTENGLVYHTGSRFTGVAGDGLGQSTGTLDKNTTPKLVLISKEINVVKMITPATNHLANVSALIDDQGRLWLAGAYLDTGTVSDPDFGQNDELVNNPSFFNSGRNSDMVPGGAIHRLWKPSILNPVKSFTGSSSSTATNYKRFIILHENGQITTYGDGRYSVTSPFAAGGIRDITVNILDWADERRFIPTLDSRINDVKEAYSAGTTNLIGQVVLKNDGTIWYIGDSIDNRAFTSNFTTPSPIPSPASWAQLNYFGNNNKEIWLWGDGSDKTLVVLKNDGIVLSIGTNNSAFLGNGTITNTTAESTQLLLNEEVVDITFAGFSTTSGIQAYYKCKNGIVYSCGLINNSSGIGSLGTYQTQSQYVPCPIITV
jgi:alpha-tubulin suppressor-like RCC1 family protein